MPVSNIEKGKAMPNSEMLKNLASALHADTDELSALVDQIDPKISQLIKGKHSSIPSFLRSTKDLTQTVSTATKTQEVFLHLSNAEVALA